ICFRLLVSETRFLGLTFALLLNTLFVSGAVNVVLVTFGLLCVLFERSLVFNQRFFVQLAAGIALFGLVVYHYSFDIINYPEQAAARGRAALHHQLSLYILSSGRSDPYLERKDIPREYNVRLDAIQRYYLAK